MIRFCLMGAAVLLASGNGLAQPRKDAAEAVQEGSVVNWLEYYRRERAPMVDAVSVPKPGPAPVVPTDTPSGGSRNR